MCSLCRWCAFIDVHINCECSSATLYRHLSVSLRPWCNLCMMDVDSTNRVCFQTQPNFQRWKGRHSANKSFLNDLRYSWTLWLAGSPVNCFHLGRTIEKHLRKHPVNFYCNQFLREMFGEVSEGNWQMQLPILLQNAPVDEFMIRAQGYNMCWQIMSFQIFTSSRSFAKSKTFFYFLIKVVWNWYMNRKTQITASTGISKPKSCLYVRSKY